MPKRVLAVGIGGTGKAALTILKERLEEAYGELPNNVVLLSIDTDDLRDNVDEFAGTKLSQQYDHRERAPEYHHVVSPPGVTMDTVFADIANGRTTAFMDWLEVSKLQVRLSQAGKNIRGGAQQRRPIGRTALFLRWSQVYGSILNAIQKMYGDADENQAVDAVEFEQSKRLVFLVSSVAGGTGSGMLIDIANLINHAVLSDQRYQSIDLSAIIVLPDAFSAYTTTMDDPTNLRPNSYAALRELDRFTRVHSANLPYMIRYGSNMQSITWSTNQPLDHVYLVDTTSRGAMADIDLSGNPMMGVFPLISDFIMAHVDQSLSDSLATLRSNAGLHYDKEEGQMYSSFNVTSCIFPIDDVIESFSYRFLRDLLARQFLTPADNRQRAQIEQQATKDVESTFSMTHVLGKVNPGIIQKALAATKKLDPERPDMSWQGLFNTIALSDTAFAEDYQDLDQALAYLYSHLVPSRTGEYRQETFSDGYQRLLNFSDHFQDEFLGLQIDPDDEASRQGGDWDKILGRYQDALRLRFSEALDAVLLDALNKRNTGNKILEPARVPHARAMVAELRKRLVTYRQRLELEWKQQDIETQLRQAGERGRDSIADMQATRDSRPPLIGKSPAQRAQEGFISNLYDRVELQLHQRIYNTVLDVLKALGADEVDSRGRKSVIDFTDEEMESWETTFREVDRIIVRQLRQHENNRESKKGVKVRRYLTDATFEDELYQHAEHFPAVFVQVVGQVAGKRGLTWEPLVEDEPLKFKLITTWGDEAHGPKDIAEKFFAGTKELFQVVRNSVSVADRIAREFATPALFTTRAQEISDPFLRFNPARNNRPMFPERYVSVNIADTSVETSQFLAQGLRPLADAGVNISSAESRFACTIVQVARGVRLSAVDQFVLCQPEYRTKLFQNQESIHLFKEEQESTDLESSIELLGEPGNNERPLAPQLVVAMTDREVLKVFIKACAYGLITQGNYTDSMTGAQSTEVFFRHQQGEFERLLPLSESVVVRELDPRFANVMAPEQLARLYLNALQNFSLKVLKKSSVEVQQVPILTESLAHRGVSLSRIENPFTLTVFQVNTAINNFIKSLGPTVEEMPTATPGQRDAESARRQLTRYLEPFLDNQVRQFKNSPAPRVVDMGTVMHLVLREEINRLRDIASRG